MNTFLRAMLIICLSLFFLNCYAIQVNVRTSSEVFALGFKVQGENHGGLGSSYSADNMPAGYYEFGVRVNNSDIACYVGGKKAVKLSTDASVNLNVHGNRCSGNLAS